MRHTTIAIVPMAALLLVLQGSLSQAEVVEFDEGLWNVRHTEFKVAEQKGKKALEVSGKYALASLKDMDFQDGTIEVDMMAPVGGPMFFGVAFRVQDEETTDKKLNYNDTLNYEYIYFRPFRSGTENAIQYSAAGTEYSWSNLRKNHPGVYEANVELPLTDWFHVRIDVEGTTAKVFVNGAEQPNLIIKDLKHGETRGSVGVYSYHKTAYFANFNVTPRK